MVRFRSAEHQISVPWRQNPRGGVVTRAAALGRLLWNHRNIEAATGRPLGIVSGTLGGCNTGREAAKRPLGGAWLMSVSRLPRTTLSQSSKFTPMIGLAAAGPFS